MLTKYKNLKMLDTTLRNEKIGKKSKQPKPPVFGLKRGFTIPGDKD